MKDANVSQYSPEEPYLPDVPANGYLSPVPENAE